jgi:hypothetical protein
MQKISNDNYLCTPNVKYLNCQMSNMYIYQKSNIDIYIQNVNTKGKDPELRQN